MKSLVNYIYESSGITLSNKDRKGQLEKWLKDRKYPDYIKTLNKMLEDPKAASLLQDGFGGDLGNMKLKFDVLEIKAKDLEPSQSEIDISKSLKHALRKHENITIDFNEPVIINNSPLITFKGKHIIDGHHRWAEVAILNPEAKMTCFNYDGNISVIEMLKAVQGTIASVMADYNENDKIPISTVNDVSIYKMSDIDIEKYVHEHITQQVCNKLEVLLGLQSQEDVIYYIIENIKRFKKDNRPKHGLPNRGEMPQTNKAGSERGNKTTTTPNTKGSALYKLRTGKINKNAIE